jgi:hypothetical protein
MLLKILPCTIYKSCEVRLWKTDHVYLNNYPPNMDEIAGADDFTVVTTKKKLRKSKATPAVTETAMSHPLPPSPSPETGSSKRNTNPFLTALRQKIPPVIIHHHFQSDMTRLNKDFNTQFQPIGFTT